MSLCRLITIRKRQFLKFLLFGFVQIKQTRFRGLEIQ